MHIFALLFAIITTFAMQPVHAAQFKIDADHSSALFKIKHFNISHTWGRFNSVSGDIESDATGLKKVTLTLKASSIDTGSKKRDAHLMKPDFFNAKQFKVLRFTSTTIKAIDKNSFSVQGNLFIHGKTKNVSVTVKKVGEGKDPYGGYRIGFDTSFTIKRSDYGMKFMIPGIGDQVTLFVSVEGIKKK